jgi:hypothetical protein
MADLYCLLIDGRPHGDRHDCARAARTALEAALRLAGEGATGEIREVHTAMPLEAIRLEPDGTFLELPF